MKQIIFEGDGLPEAESFLTSQYARVRLSGEETGRSFSFVRRVFSDVSLDGLTVPSDFSFTCDGFESFCLVSVHHGVFTMHRGSGMEAHGPGSVMLLSRPGESFRGNVTQNAQTAVLVHPSIINRAAGIDEDAGCPLGEFNPVSRDAEARLCALVAHLVGMADAGALDNRLVAKAATDYLAAAILDGFPREDPPSAGTSPSYGRTWQRAARFIEDNAHRAIGIAEIAAAAQVSARAVQYAFVRHAGMTPMSYLRQVRLAHAHVDLLGADPHLATVGQIASKWGFSNAGRFAAFYRDAYGLSPCGTLRKE
ncbi:helix-turn-helix domain-containing protein [Streptomyces sp. NPDC057939]|uniref:helix-turn-helix domain-containing protein n=1 Tax=Streptomyces sp. NPDC057939 TaxID=3346284 RepID=UPI0036EEDC98